MIVINEIVETIPSLHLPYHLHDIDTETHNRLTLSVLPKVRRFICSRNGFVHPDLAMSAVIPVPKIVEVVNQSLYRQSDE